MVKSLMIGRVFDNECMLGFFGLGYLGLNKFCLFTQSL